MNDRRCQRCEAPVDVLDNCEDCLLKGNETYASGRKVKVFELRTHCSKGHEFTEENTRMNPAAREKHDFQICRTCARDGVRKSNEKKKALCG